MSKFTLDWDYKGFGTLIRSAACANMVENHANIIKNRCGSGYTAHVYRDNKYVPVGIVAANTTKAINDNNDNNTLIKALR